MKKSHMKGIIDPITIAFLLSIVGTVATLTLDKGPSDQAQAQAVSTSPVTLVASE